jgi:hypothetical protein
MKIVRSPTFSASGLFACRNPELAKLRAHKRESLITATKVELENMRAMVARGRLSGAAAGSAESCTNKKVGKHFEPNITDQSFDVLLLEDKIADEAALDGVYVILTDVSKRKMSADDTVRAWHMREAWADEEVEKVRLPSEIGAPR